MVSNRVVYSSKRRRKLTKRAADAGRAVVIFGQVLPPAPQTQAVRRLPMDIKTLLPIAFVGKIVNTHKERWLAHMPHFYNYKNTQYFGNITVIPKGIHWIRLGGYGLVPYMTMSNIQFTLRVDKLPRSGYNVYLQLADGSYRTLATIDKNEVPVSGVAMYTGDTKIFIAPFSYTDASSERFIAKEGILLFEDRVQHLNDYIYGGCSVALLVITVIGVLLAWLLGIIQIDPTWIARFNP